MSEELNAKGQEETKRFHVSLLFGKAILGVELALLVLIIYFHIVPLIIFLIFMIGINLVVIGWKKKALDKLTVSFQLDRIRIFAGEQVQVKTEIHNNKLLPLTWLEYMVESPAGMNWEDTNQENYQICLLWVLWKQRVGWEFTANHNQRGVYAFRNVILRSGDGFRFTEGERRFSVNSTLYVWPKLIPVTVPQLSTAIRWAMQGKNKGYMDDPLLVQGIRDYQNGDEWRKISWQASARTGMLQTKVYQPVRLQAIQLFFDVSGFEQSQYADRFEQFVSIVASVTLAYENQGIAVDFVSNDENKKAQGITEIMDLLAGITMNSYGRLPLDIAGSAPLFFFCHHITLTHVEWAQRLRKEVAVFFYVAEQSKEQAHLQGYCSVKRIDELRMGKS